MSSEYTTWVEFLRRWGEDPSTSMANLPPMTAESLPPQAFQRLFVHLNKAIQAVTKRGWDQFGRAWASATSEHDRALALVALRKSFAHQLILAQSSLLPEEVRLALRNAAERDLPQAQSDLECEAMRQSASGRSDRAGSEDLLRLLRINSITAILTPSFPLDALFRQESVVVAPRSPAPDHPSANIPTPVARRRRSIVSED